MIIVRTWQRLRPVLGGARLLLMHPRREGARRLRRRFFLVAGRFTPILIRELPDRLLVVPTGDLVTGQMTFLNGAFEPATLDRAIAILEGECDFTLSGRRVVEIGAHVGIETVRFLLDYDASHVTAFEPHPANHRILEMNVVANALGDRVTAHRLALSDQDGSVVFEESRDNWGDHRVRVPNRAGDDLESERTTITVPAATLDRLISDGVLSLDEVGLVWIDTQGHEGNVLAGGLALLRAGIPIVVEYWPYGLDRAAGLDRFQALVAEYFGTVFDLRSGRGAGTPPRRLATDEFPALDVGDSSAYTDLLLIPRAGDRGR